MLKIDDVASLKGRFLMASPYIPDERFVKNVIFITQAALQSSFGFVLSDKIVETNIFQNTIFKNANIYYGGPTDPEKYFLLHTKDVTWAQSLNIKNDLMITTMKDVLKYPKECTPLSYKIISGFVSWQMNQLDQEIMLGYWIVLDEEESMFFENNNNAWKVGMKKMQIDTNRLSGIIGSA